MKRSEEVVAEIAKQTDTVLLAFSCGKDSVAAWIAIRDHFKRVIPFYRYLVPGLEFVESALDYYEDFFQTRIMRVPHPSLYRMLNNFVYQAPENVPVIEAAGLPEFDYDELNACICEDKGIPRDTFVASGVRGSDSIARRRHFVAHGPITYSHRTFYPVWDWKKAALIDVFKQHGVRLPVDYQIFGRSFDGIRFSYVGPIKKHFPRDYERIRAFFPMIETEFRRQEYAQKEYTAADF